MQEPQSAQRRRNERNEMELKFGVRSAFFATVAVLDLEAFSM